MPQSIFALAVDVGTSRTAAAIARSTADGSAVVTPFALGRRSDSVATTVFVAPDGELVFGDAAERRGIGQPERLVREFKRHVGDDVPVTVGGRAIPPEELFAQSLAAVVETVTTREGTPPALVSVTHPTVWGPHRLGLIAEALRRCGVDDIILVPEPEAAAHHYEAARPLAAGGLLAVYDLGGGTFDAIILRKREDAAFAVIGTPAGIDDLGGADFDDAVLRYTLDAAGIDTAALSIHDADTRLALSHLRRECVDAKEALSFDADVTIPVLLPSTQTTVRLTRAEFERMIESDLDRTLDSLEAALDSADVAPDDLETILLVGGSSRIPLVAQRLSDRFDRPLAVDADPKAAVALGAARLGLAAVESRAVSTDVPTTAFDDLLAETAGRLVPLGPTGTPLASVRSPEHARRRRIPVVALTASAAVAATLAWGGITAAASWFGQPTGDEAPVDGSTGSTSADTAADLTWPAPAPAPGPGSADSANEPKADAEPNDQANGARPSPRSSPHTSKDPTVRPDRRGTAGSHGPGRAPTPPSPSAHGPASGPAPATPPVDPGPANPNPADPPVDPTPSDPPDPTPTDPPSDPAPTDPPVDPTPTDPPADPAPTDPPSDPAPTEPPADPAPTEPPAEPTPEPTQPV